MKRKVAFFHPYFVFGGVEKTNLRLSKYFIEHGYEVDFISLSFSEHLDKQIQELGIKKIALNVSRTAWAIPKLRKYMQQEQEKYELTFISCQNYANLIAIISMPLKRNHLKIIVSERSNPREFFLIGKEKKGKLIIALMKLLYKRADIIMANSQEAAEEISRIVGKKVICIHNPTLTEDYEKLGTEPVEKEWFTDDIPIIISVGRLSITKGFDTLIKAFAIAQKQVACRLVIIGEGEKRTELEELTKELGIKDLVWMPGYDSNPYKYVAKSDVFVLSSLYEGLPNVLIEALALGIPCVSTKCKSGPKEILLEGKGGYLVEVNDEKKMAEAILASLNDRESALQMLKEAEKMLSRFKMETVGARYLEVIEK